MAVSSRRHTPSHIVTWPVEIVFSTTPLRTEPPPNLPAGLSLYLIGCPSRASSLGGHRATSRRRERNGRFPEIARGWIGLGGQSSVETEPKKREKFGARICLNSGRRTYESPFRSVACFASLRITCCAIYYGG